MLTDKPGLITIEDEAGSNGDKCCLPTKVSLTCPWQTVTSESTDVVVSDLHSAVSWNTTNGVVVDSWCGPASALTIRRHLTAAGGSFHGTTWFAAVSAR